MAKRGTLRYDVATRDDNDVSSVRDGMPKIADRRDSSGSGMDSSSHKCSVRSHRNTSWGKHRTRSNNDGWHYGNA